MAEESVTLTLEVKDRMTGALKGARDAVSGLSKSLDDTAAKSKPSKFGFQALGKQMQVVNRMALTGASGLDRVRKGMGDAAQAALGFGKKAAGGLQSFTSGFGSVGTSAAGLASRLRTVGGQIGSTLKSMTTSAATSLKGHAQMFASGFRDASAAANGFTGKMGSLGGAVRKALDSSVNAVRGVAPKFRQAGQRAGEAFKTAATKGFQGLKAAAGAALAAVAAVGTVAITKGFSRLQGIEQAQAKLTGLGNSAQDVEQIMENALAAVKGTAFGMDEAATTAASAVAAGIKPGQDLEKMLTLVGDSAAIAGVGMTEMGSIWNKVATSNKVQGDILNQLGDTGIPIVQLLAEELGVTAAEVYKMGEAGSIGFAEFQAAMESGMGGAAQAMGGTFSGAWANMFAALGRLGASFLEGIFPTLAPGMSSITALIDAANEKITPFAEKIGSVVGPAMSKFAEVVEGLATGGAAGLFEKLEGMGGIIGPLAGAFAALGTSAAGSLPMIGKFLPVLNPVLGAILGLVAASPELRNGLFGMIQQLVPVIIGLFQQLAPVFQQVIGLVLSVVQRLVPAVMPLIKTVVTVAALIAGSLVKAVTQILPPVLSLVSVLMDLVFAVLTPVIPLVSFLARVLGVVLAVAIQVVAKIIVWLVNIIRGILTPVIRALTAVFTYMGPVIVAVWEGIRTAAAAVADWFTGTLVPAFQAVWDGITAAASWAYNNIIKPIFTGLQIAFLAVATIWTLYWNTVLKPVIDGFAAAALWLWNNAITPALNGIRSAWGWLMTALQTAWQSVGKPVIDAVGTAIRWLKDNVWTPVLNGIKWAWNMALAGIRTVWQTVLSPTLSAVGTAIKWLKDNVWNPVASAMKAAWSGMGDGIRWVKNNVIDPVFDGIKTGVRRVQTSFENAKDGIGTAWGKLKELTAAPVRFVVNEVYNKGIRETWNGIAEAVKLDNLKMPKFNLSFATGGVLPGYTPGRDVHRFTSPTGGNLYLSGGEAIMRPEFTRAIGGEEGVHRLNALARSGRVDEVHNVVDHAFRTGGVYPSGPVAGVNAFADAGVWRGLWAIVKDKFPNAIKTSDYRGGSRTVSGNASYHSRGMAVDLAGPMSQIFAFLRSNYGNSREIIYSPANGQQIKNGRNHMYGGAVRSMHFNHVHWANDRVPAGAPDYVPGSGGGDGFLSQLFDLGPLKAFSKKFEGLGGGGWGEMIGAAGKNLINSLVEKISPFQFGDVVADVGETISKGAAYAKGQTWATLRGLNASQRNAMNWIVQKESGWNPRAQNPRSTASGLPQMIDATARAYLGGAPAKNFGVFDQLDGMRKYVNDRYGGWGGALSYWKKNNHYAGGGVLPSLLGLPTGLYDNGGIIPGGGAVAVSKTRDPELVSTAAQARAQTDLLRAAAERERERASGSGAETYVTINIEGVDLSDHPSMERAVKRGVEAAVREARERR